MIESDLSSVAILIVVDTRNFAEALVSVLRNCAPYPVQAAVTNSLDHGLSFLQTTDVDLVLIDAFLPDSTESSTLHKLRQASVVPAIAFARALNENVARYLTDSGAQAVLPRDCFDAVTLVNIVGEVIARSKFDKPLAHTITGPAEQHIVSASTSDRSETASLLLRNHIAGANKLKEILTSQEPPDENQRAKLRQVLGRFSSKQNDKLR